MGHLSQAGGGSGGAAATQDAFEGQNLYAVGHSFLAGNAGSFTPSASYINRLVRRWGIHTLTNAAVAGSVSSDALGYTIDGGNAIPASFKGLILFDSVTNDAAKDQADNGGSAPSAAYLAGHLNSVSSFCYLARAIATGATLIDDTNAAITYPSGSFTAVTGNPQDHAGTNHFSTSTGAQIQIAWNGAWGTTAVIMLLGWGPGTSAGTAQVKVDGTVVQTVSTANQSLKSTDQKLASGFTLQPIVVTMSAGNHTILITNTGAAGSQLGIDCVTVPVAAGTAPQIILVKDSPVGAGSNWGPGGISQATADAVITAFNANLPTAAALFPAGEVVVADCYSAFNASTMACALDGVHPNDHGHGFFADNIQAAAATPVWNTGSAQL